MSAATMELPLDLLMSTEDLPSTTTVRMDVELVRKARIICAHSPGRAGKQLKLVDLLDSLVRSGIESRYRAVLADAAAEGQGEKRGRKAKGEG